GGPLPLLPVGALRVGRKPLRGREGPRPHPALGGPQPRPPVEPADGLLLAGLRRPRQPLGLPGRDVERLAADAAAAPAGAGRSRRPVVPRRRRKPGGRRTHPLVRPRLRGQRLLHLAGRRPRPPARRRGPAPARRRQRPARLPAALPGRRPPGAVHRRAALLQRPRAVPPDPSRCRDLLRRRPGLVRRRSHRPAGALLPDLAERLRQNAARHRLRPEPGLQPLGPRRRRAPRHRLPPRPGRRRRQVHSVAGVDARHFLAAGMHALQDRGLFFLHIPKTAGTSLRELLSSRFAPAEILAFEREDSPERRQEKLTRIDRYPFVHGHVPYALADRFARRPFVATILRDPLERAVSAFHYMQGQVPGLVSAARARDYSAASRMSIGELIRHEPLAASRHLGNLQAWFLSTPKVHERFEYHDEYRVAVSGSDLERAKEHLEACDFVGLTERMGESMDLLGHALRDRPFGEAGTANRSRGRPAVASLDPSTMAALTDLTAQDRELYTFACRLFEHRLRAMTQELHNAYRPRQEAGHRSLAPVFAFDRAIPGDGWYAPERAGERWFSWTGPSCDSTLELASPPGREVVLK